MYVKVKYDFCSNNYGKKINLEMKIPLRRFNLDWYVWQQSG